MNKNKNLKIILTLLLLCFCFLPVNAFYWGVVDDYENDFEEYALYKVIKNEPINYYLEYSDTAQATKFDDTNSEEFRKKLIQQLSEEEKNAELQGLVQKGFDTWLKDTKKMINADGRTQEFADILPFLSRPTVKLKRVYNKNKADISIYFDNPKEIEKECSGRSGCFLNKKMIILTNPYFNSKDSYEDSKKIALSVITHEIGHYYALADQYEDTYDTSLVHSTFNRMYSDSIDAIMGGSWNTVLSCDDVDGFINLIDLTLAIKNNKIFSARAKKGWASFCNGKKDSQGKKYQDEFYREAKLIKKPNYTRGYCLYKYDKDGNVAQENCMDPFDFTNNELFYSKNDIDIRKDKKNQINYQYEYDNLINNEFVVFAFDEKTDQDLAYFSVKKQEKDKGYSWVIDESQKNYKQRLINSTLVDISDTYCLAMDRVLTSSKKSENLLTLSEIKKEKYDDVYYFATTFDRQYRLTSISYMPLEKNTKNIAFEVAIDPIGKECIYYSNINGYKNVKVVSLVNFDQGPIQISYQNKEILDYLTKRSNVSVNKFLNKFNERCRKLTSHPLVEKNKLKCKYFVGLENYFR